MAKMLVVVVALFVECLVTVVPSASQQLTLFLP